jgi:hypothetical protein
MQSLADTAAQTAKTIIQFAGVPDDKKNMAWDYLDATLGSEDYEKLYNKYYEKVSSGSISFTATD